MHLYKANNLTLKDAFFQSQLHCIIKTLLTFFQSLHKANVSRIALMHTKHVSNHPKPNTHTHTNRFSRLSGTSCTTIIRRRANRVSQTHSLTSLKADMKLGRSWQARADRRRRGEARLSKAHGSMFCILGPAEGFTGHKSALARLGIIYSSGRGPFDLGCRLTLHQQSLSLSLSLALRYQRTVTKASLCVQQVALKP